MAQLSYPFENQDTTETQYSALFSRLQLTGVDGDYLGQSLRVTANTGMQVNVAAGYAIVRGFAYENTAVETLTLDTGNTQARIDLVILRLDPSANSIVLAVKKGTPAASPVAPALTQVPGAVWEMMLAQVAVAANATAIGINDITDYRRFLGTQVTSWKTWLRPENPSIGVTGYNSSLAKHEFWDGSAWQPVGNEAGVYSGVRTEGAAANLPLTNADVGKVIVYTGATGTLVTLFGASLTAGSRIDFIQDGAGQITFQAGAGNTLQAVDSKFKTNKQYSGATAVYLGSNSWRLIGDLAA